ncbi:hypothetical protein [Candidatus Methanoperedens nitratireducens]|uniref:hypothetical protein n=1 Tax=Candidatus Methanoperedens nitratireducens TaxID=1392998 RepID=UPI000BB93846|nr:hypothetical protein [Candidatus Methanoperedens nitroreducens]
MASHTICGYIWNFICNYQRENQNKGQRIPFIGYQFDYFIFSIGIFGNLSIANEPLNLIVLSFMIFILLGALLILAKGKVVHQKWVFDSASLILVSDLLILSFLTGLSIGARLAFINLILTLFLLVKAQYYRLIFYIILALNLFFLTSYIYYSLVFLLSPDF